MDTEDDDETQDVPFNAQNLIADESFETPPSPPAQVSPEIDYLDRVEQECRDRECNENDTQKLSPGYLAMLNNMCGKIDDWLEGGGVAPAPADVKRFARHNWCVRLLSRKQRIRISKLRLRLDMILEEEDARKEEIFWNSVENVEPNARTLIPLCLICRNDLRNEMFTVNRLNCGHMFHTICIVRHLDDNNNPMCPNCNTAIANAGERTHFNYE